MCIVVVHIRVLHATRRNNCNPTTLILVQRSSSNWLSLTIFTPISHFFGSVHSDRTFDQYEFDKSDKLSVEQSHASSQSLQHLLLWIKSKWILVKTGSISISIPDLSKIHLWSDFVGLGHYFAIPNYYSSRKSGMEFDWNTYSQY